MTERKKVIARKFFPTHIPITGTLAWGLALDRFHVPGWVWGAWATLWGIVWIAVLYSAFYQDEYEPVLGKEL